MPLKFIPQRLCSNQNESNTKRAILVVSMWRAKHIMLKIVCVATLCGCWILMPLHERDLMRLSDLIQGKFDFAFLLWSVWFSCLCYFHGLGRKQFSVVSLLWSFLSDILRNKARFACISFNTCLQHICYYPITSVLQE